MYFFILLTQTSIIVKPNKHFPGIFTEDVIILSSRCSSATINKPLSFWESTKGVDNPKIY